MSNIDTAPATSPSPTLPLRLGLVLAVLTGMLVPVQSRVNGGLSGALGDPRAAAVVSFGVGLIAIVAVTFCSAKGRKGFRNYTRALTTGALPWWSLFAGACGAMLVLSQTSTVNIIGVAIFTIAIVAGQTVSGLAVDKIGLGPSGSHPLTTARVVGAVGVLVAVTIAVMGRQDAGVDALSIVLPVLGPLIAGLLLGFQQAMNGRVAVAAGTPLVATTINFATGGVVLVTIWLIGMRYSGPPAALPPEWWLYIGGIIGVCFIGSAAWLVRHIGVLLLGLGTISGQLIGSLLLDVIVPTPGSTIQTTTVLGTLLTLAAVGVASLPSDMTRRLRRPRPSRTSY